tara:strand:+ start:565 stop:810 length:246 start_codon:yes stop_codon:yes gene_type:complete
MNKFFFSLCILGTAFLTYYATVNNIDHMKSMWETAYKMGYGDGNKIAEAQYKWTEEKLRQECMLLHFEDDQERRERLGFKR